MTHLIFVGAFNPPTAAHLLLPEMVMKETGAAGVVYVPSKTRYITEEQGKDFAFSDLSRLKMLRTLAESRPWMRVSDYELQADHQPRTYETLCALREQGIQGRLLMGSDKLPELEDKWLYVREIADQFGLVCMDREGDDSAAVIASHPFLRSISERIQVIHTPALTKTVSSSRIRKSLLEYRRLQGSINELLPDGLNAGQILKLLENQEQ